VSEAPTWMSAIATVAQVIVAAVALYLAFRANRLNKDALFMQRIIAELFDIVALARKVKVSYVRMFDPFDTPQSKNDARATWLKIREEVAERLAEIRQMFSEVGVVVDAWSKLEEEEDTHIMGAVLKIDDPHVIADATKRYSRTHEAFIQELGKLVRTLRQ